MPAGPGPGRRALVVAAFLTLVPSVAAAQSPGPATGATPSPMPASSTTQLPSASPATSTYVAFGDSWPFGAHCGGCRPFPELYADGLEATTEHPIDFVNLTTNGGGAPSLLYGADFGKTVGVAMTRILRDVQCEVAAAHAARCVDLGLTLNGPGRAGRLPRQGLAR